MSLTYHRGVASIVLAFVLAMPVSLVAAPTAAAKTFRTDCGKTTCSRVWTVDATERISDGFNSLGYTAGEAIQASTHTVCKAAEAAGKSKAGKALPYAVKMVAVLCKSIVGVGGRLSAQPMIGAAKRAESAGGCLQATYPKKGKDKGKPTWSHTTDKSVCK